MKNQPRQEARGGARANAGRKPVADKKVPITIYVQESKVKHLGGAGVLKERLYQTIKHT